MCAALNAWIFSPARGFNAKFLLCQATTVRNRTKSPKSEGSYKVVHVDCVFRITFHRREVQVPSYRGKVKDVLLFQVIPYDLKWLDRVCVLFAVPHGENSEH